MTSKRLERSTYSVRQAAELLGVSADTAYTQIKAHDELAGVPVVRVSGRIVIPAARLDEALGIRRTTRKQRTA